MNCVHPSAKVTAKVARKWQFRRHSRRVLQPTHIMHASLHFRPFPRARMCARGSAARVSPHTPLCVPHTLGVRLTRGRAGSAAGVSTRKPIMTKTQGYIVANLTRGTFDGIFTVDDPAFAQQFTIDLRELYPGRQAVGLAQRTLRPANRPQGPLDERATERCRWPPARLRRWG